MFALLMIGQLAGKRPTPCLQIILTTSGRNTITSQSQVEAVGAESPAALDQRSLGQFLIQPSKNASDVLLEDLRAILLS
jgi:hypothetical protein